MDSLAKKIVDAIGKYHTGFMKKKVLKTVEEIEATSDPLEKYIAGAEAVDELNNKLAHGRVELVVNSDGSLGYKLDGADTVHPFIKIKSITVPISCSFAVSHPSSYSGTSATVTASLVIDLINKTTTLSANNPDISRANLKITGITFAKPNISFN